MQASCSLNTPERVQLLQLADADADVAQDGSAARGCVAAVPTYLPNGVLVGLTVLHYGNASDHNTCTTNATSSTALQFSSTGGVPPRMPVCPSPTAAAPVPVELQGFGRLQASAAATGSSDSDLEPAPSRYFPAPLLVVDATSINIVTFGAAPPRALRPLASPSFAVSHVQTYCISAASSYQSGAAYMISLTLPYFSLPGAPDTCVRAEYSPSNAASGSVPIFYHGTQRSAGGQLECVPDPSQPPLPWLLESWQPAPPAGAGVNAAAVAAGVVVPVVVLGAAAVVLWGRRHSRNWKGCTGWWKASGRSAEAAPLIVHNSVNPTY